MSIVSVFYKYTGSGFFTGIPARDLLEADVAQLPAAALAEAVASGLYVDTGVAKPALPTETPVTLDLSDGVNDTEASAAGKALSRRRKG